MKRTIARKLAILAGAPLLALIVAGAFLLKTAYEQSSEAKQASFDLQLFQESSELIHLMQAERGLSVSLLNGADAEKKLFEQRTKVDAQIERTLPTLSDASLTKENKELIQTNLTARLSELREGVTSRSLKPGQAAKQYTRDLVKLLLKAERSLANHTGLGEIGRYMQSIPILELGKENGGLFRANLSGMLARNQPLSSQQLNKILTLKAGLDTNIHSPVLQLSDAVANNISEYANQAHWQETDRVFKLVVTQSTQGNYGVDPLLFFGEASKAVDDVKTAISESLLYLEPKIAEVRSSALKMLLFEAFVILALFVGITIFAFLTTSGISKPLKETVDALKALASGDLTKKLNVNTRDEVELMADAFNASLDGIQKALEAEKIDWASVSEQKKKAALLAEADKKKTQELNDRVEALLRVIESAKSGDLTVVVPRDGEGAIGDMQSGIRDFITHLSGTIQKIEEGAREVSNSSEGLLGTSTEMVTQANDGVAKSKEVAKASEQINQAMLSVSASSEEMNASFGEVARSTNNAAEFTRSAVKLAEEATDKIEILARSSEEIGGFVNDIAGIASQTNLLALNATIESARAGEAGKGFSVVANEVKELANQSSGASTQIQEKIQRIQDDTQASIEAIRKVTELISKINNVATSIAASVEEQSATTATISASITEAATGTEGIASNIVKVTDISEQAAKGGQDTTKASEDLLEVAKKLKEAVDYFKTNTSVEESPVPTLVSSEPAVEEQSHDSYDDAAPVLKAA